MSGVHDNIALQAFNVLPNGEQKIIRPYLEDLKKSSWYPDFFADRTMPKSVKRKIDPEADRFMYPLPPKSSLYKKILKLTEEEEKTGVAPLRYVYLIEHYFKNALKSLKSENLPIFLIEISSSIAWNSWKPFVFKLDGFFLILLGHFF